MTVKLTQNQISRMTELYDRLEDYRRLINHFLSSYPSETNNFSPFYIKSKFLTAWEWTLSGEGVKIAILDEMHHKVFPLIKELDAMNCEIPKAWNYYKNGTLIWNHK